MHHYKLVNATPHRYKTAAKLLRHVLNASQRLLVEELSCSMQLSRTLLLMVAAFVAADFVDSLTCHECEIS